MRRWSIPIVLAAAILVPALPARCKFRARDWELTLAGTGTTSTSGDTSGDSAFGLRVGVGYFFTDNIELSLRQQIAYSNLQNASAFRGQTVLALDWNFNLEPKWEPFIGVQGGFQYGDVVADSLSAGPEIGVRYFLTDDAFVYLSIEYDIIFKTGRSGSESADDQFVYMLGLGLKL